MSSTRWRPFYSSLNVYMADCVFQLSDEDREAILKLSLDDLIAKLQSRDLKAVDVLEAYQYAVRVR